MHHRNGLHKKTQCVISKLMFAGFCHSSPTSQTLFNNPRSSMEDMGTLLSLKNVQTYSQAMNKSKFNRGWRMFKN